jgi:hypothetical protein
VPWVAAPPSIGDNTGVGRKEGKGEKGEAGNGYYLGQSTLAAPDVIEAKIVGLTFQLLAGEPRPQIQATHSASGRQWVF